MSWDGKKRRLSDSDDTPSQRLANLESQYLLVNNTLIDLKERMDRHGKNYETMHGEIKGFMESINKSIVGDTDKPGLAEKVRGLEGMAKVAWAGFVGAVLFVADTLKDFIMGHK